MDPTTARVRDIFDDWARNGRAEGMEAGHGPSARVGVAALELRHGHAYLDIGCGNGYTLAWASETVGGGGRVVGLDVAPGMVSRAQERVQKLANAEVKHAAFPVHDLGEACFDGIFSMEVFYYLKDLPAALEAARALLVPGGRFACLVDYYGENEASHAWPAQLDCEMTLLSAAGWQDAFAAAGFVDVTQQRVRPEPDASGAAGWKQQIGSLLTVGRRAE